MNPAELVEAFYFEVWNRADEDRARAILAESFRFRGSLGAERSGPDGFIAYMRDVHRALGDYRCIIDELVTDGDRAAARMRFTGKHRAEFLGVAATGRQVTWAGPRSSGSRAGRSLSSGCSATWRTCGASWRGEPVSRQRHSWRFRRVQPVGDPENGQPK